VKETVTDEAREDQWLHRQGAAYRKERLVIFTVFKHFDSYFPNAGPLAQPWSYNYSNYNCNHNNNTIRYAEIFEILSAFRHQL